MKQYLSRILSGLMSAAILCGAVGMASYSAGAESTASANHTAAQKQTDASATTDNHAKKALSKTETVYVIAKADGTPEKVIVSDWIQNPGKASSVLDKTDLRDVRAVKGDATYSINEQKLYEWKTQGEDIYYRGTGTAELPVGVRLSCKLDGKAIDPSQLAGKSGKVTMRFDYENRQYSEVTINGKKEKIYVPFAMLTGMLLDNEKFCNVEVVNGKVVNDGSHTYVAGFALPGLQESLGIAKKDMEIPSYVEITAEVRDFELATTLTVATNELFTELDTDKLDEKYNDLDKQLTELSDAAGKLCDGSSALYKGLGTLLEKSGELVDGVDKLYDGAQQLRDGSGDLDDGAQTLASGANDLYDGVSDLNEGAGQLDEGAGTLNSGAKALDSGAAALKDGAGKLDDGAGKLKSGAKALDDGAQALSAGAGSLDAGVATLRGHLKDLSDGLGKISSKSVELNGGAKKVFDTLLATAGAQITAAGLDAGELTVDNYGESLDTLIASLDSDTVQQYACAKALETVTATVNSQKELIRQAVENEVRKQVTEGVLAAVGYSMSFDEYEAAIAAGQVPEEVQAQVTAATAAQMAGMEDTIDAKTEEQVQTLIDQNMNGDEVQAQIAAAVSQARAGKQSLEELKGQLDSYNTFYRGVLAYTAGVDKASGGAKQIYGGTKDLKDGSAQLKNGAAELKSGTKTLRDGAKDLKDGTKDLRDGTVTLKNGTGDLKDGAGKLKSGTGDLKNGADQLKDGTGALKDGANRLSSGTGALNTGADQLFGGISTLRDACPALTDGVKQLHDGSMQLNDGMKEFKSKGVDKIKEAFDGDLKTLLDRVKAIRKAAQGYQSYGGIADNTEGKVDFIIKTDGITEDE